jgi:hypothetical protein
LKEKIVDMRSRERMLAGSLHEHETE